MNTIQYIREQIMVLITYIIAVLAGFGTLFMASQIDQFSIFKIMAYSFLASSFVTYYIVLMEAR